MDIRIESLTHRYSRLQAPIFKALNIHFDASRVHGIVGENGTGKTTLLRLISGLEKVQHGNILIGEQPTTPLRVRSEGIVYVASKSLVLSGSVLDNVILPLCSRGLSEGQATSKVEGAMRDLDIWRLKNQSAGTLSSGETQKLAWIRALSIAPQVLLVDEPTGNVDHAMTGVMEAQLRHLVAKHGTTVLLVSHNKDQIKRVACRVWTLTHSGLAELKKEHLC